MRYTSLSLVLTWSAAVLAELNGFCANGRTPGTCVATADCDSIGGTFEAGNCPDDPDDVICCSKAACSASAPESDCRSTASCSGSTEANLCPGSSDFMCCIEDNSFDRPTIPPDGCQQVSLDSGDTILTAFPGYIYEVGCYGEREGSSEHPEGLALDLMVGYYNPSGWEVAEYVMENCAPLSCIYVIWGQHIWHDEDSVMPWEDWEQMEDRGDLTSNHWDHVHVSFAG